MKHPVLLAFAVTLLAGQAWAQPKVDGKLPPLEQLPLLLQLELDPKLPPFPELKATQPARIEIRVLETYRGPMLQMEVVRKTPADAVAAVVAAMGGKCVIDPALSRRFFTTAVFRALTLEELLDALSRNGIETWKSLSGTYFFADAPDPVIEKMQDDLRNRKPAPVDPNADPFVNRGAPLNKIVPEPHWGKIPFNGRDVFVVPLP